MACLPSSVLGRSSTFPFRSVRSGSIVVIGDSKMHNKMSKHGKNKNNEKRGTTIDKGDDDDERRKKNSKQTAQIVVNINFYGTPSINKLGKKPRFVVRKYFNFEKNQKNVFILRAECPRGNARSEGEGETGERTCRCARWPVCVCTRGIALHIFCQLQPN